MDDETDEGLVIPEDILPFALMFWGACVFVGLLLGVVFVQGT